MPKRSPTRAQHGSSTAAGAARRTSYRKPQQLSRRRCLAAVAARDAQFDRAFVYAVRSTGIYCRPSCAARRPSPRNIQFFTLPEAAQYAGFRPCLRCHPQHAPRSQEVERVRRACRAIETQEEPRASLVALAKAAGTSPDRLQRAFRRLMGISPRQYADAVRVARLKSDLRKGSNVTTALYEAGFGSTSRLYERSNALLGMTPGTYAGGGRGMRISYTVTGCALGRILVAGTERGISAVYLGDADGPMVAALRDEYPQAEIRAAAREHAEWVREIVGHVAGNGPGLDLPLDLPTDVVATAFQRRVWEALRAIPRGATRTYSEIARQIGQPTATRAVAHACATNPTSIVVPCHRVIRMDGSLGGYRWGLGRKEKLLEVERRGSGTPAPKPSDEKPLHSS